MAGWVLESIDGATGILRHKYILQGLTVSARRGGVIAVEALCLRRNKQRASPEAENYPMLRESEDDTAPTASPPATYLSSHASLETCTPHYVGEEEGMENDDTLRLWRAMSYTND